MHPSKALLAKKEIKKYLNVGFISPIDYSKWMANILPITEPTREIIICIDFKDINNACPKDDFPLPNIDMIVDSIIGHDTLYFMYGFLGYNQIILNPIDQHKTTFTITYDNFYWKVMPFGSKNTRANYQ